MRQSEVFNLIKIERQRQREKWERDHEWGKGDCSSRKVNPTVKATVLLEEVGEVARSVLDRDDLNLRTELTHVAAVAVAWLEGME